MLGLCHEHTFFVKISKPFFTTLVCKDQHRGKGRIIKVMCMP